MNIVFKREIKANFKALLIWSAVMLAMSVIGFGEYGFLMGENSTMNFDAMINMMPRIIKVMFGMGSLSINTPEGWYVCMYLWCAIISYVHAALLGANIISKEESDKTAEFLYTKPIKRSSVISGKILAALTAVFSIVVVCWLATLIVFVPFVKNISDFLLNGIHVTMLCMFITSLVFLFAGLCISTLCTGRGKAAQYSAITVIATYFLSVGIETIGGVEYLDFLSPFRYFNASDVITNGINPLFILLSVGLVAVTGYFTYFLYARRNLHS